MCSQPIWYNDTFLYLDRLEIMMEWWLSNQWKNMSYFNSVIICHFEYVFNIFQLWRHLRIIRLNPQRKDVDIMEISRIPYKMGFYDSATFILCWDFPYLYSSCFVKNKNLSELKIEDCSSVDLNEVDKFGYSVYWTSICKDQFWRNWQICSSWRYNIQYYNSLISKFFPLKKLINLKVWTHYLFFSL